MSPNSGKLRLLTLTVSAKYEEEGGCRPEVTLSFLFPPFRSFAASSFLLAVLPCPPPPPPPSRPLSLRFFSFFSLLFKYSAQEKQPLARVFAFRAKLLLRPANSAFLSRAGASGREKERERAKKDDEKVARRAGAREEGETNETADRGGAEGKRERKRKEKEEAEGEAKGGRRGGGGGLGSEGGRKERLPAKGGGGWMGNSSETSTFVRIFHRL